MNGPLEKLTILAFKDPKYENVADKNAQYVALINPEQIAIDTKIHYVEDTAPGKSGGNNKLNKIASPNLSIKFLFDGTGIISITNSKMAKLAFEEANKGPGQGGSDDSKSTSGTVEEQINVFKKVTAEFKNDTHEPRYVKLYWGKIIFRGRLKSLKITYTLFKPDGSPIRATGDAVFVGSVDPVSEAKERNAQSPDLTHVRVVKEGDTLPLLCHQIYEDSSLYLQVARVNKLSNYRNLKAGTKLFFPPVKEQA